MVTGIQPSFAAGELGPSLYGRVDVAKYAVGLRTAKNVFIRPHGGAANRAGLQFVGPVNTHGNTVRLIPFLYNTTQTYVLEFGNLYMRVIKDGGYVTEAAKAITGATQANPCVITSNAHGYSNGDQLYIAGVAGMTRLNGRTFIAAGVTANTFQLTDQVTGSNIDSTAFAAYTSGGTVARIYKIASPYAQADLARLKFTQSADVMTFTHPSYDVYELSRTGHTSWTFATVTFAPSIDAPTGLGITVTSAGSVTQRYRVTAIKSETLEESLPALSTASNAISAITKANPGVVTYTGTDPVNGDEINISGVVGMTELNGRRFTIANLNTGAKTFELLGENTSTYGTYTSGGTINYTFSIVTNSTSTPKNTIAWTAVAGAVKYDIYREKSGVFGYIGTSTGVSFVDDNIAPDTTTSPPSARNPFYGSNNKPGVVSYYEQRRVFGASNNKPDTSWFSQTANTKNMSVSTPSQDDDAITATLTARQVNEIRHFVPMNDLIVLTSGSEWRVNSGTDSAFAPSTIRQKPQSYWGASHIPPIVIGNSILFVQDRGSMVRNIGYQVESDGYDGQNLTILSGHLFEGRTVSEWAFAQIPDSIIWCVMSDGAALSLTYNKEQQVVAWTRHETDGLFKSVACVPEGSEDAVYFVVQRTINGQTVQYVERMKSRYFTAVADCFFVDAGATYSGVAATTISGLDHLEGKTVTALADGNVVSGKVVTNGAITIPNASTKVQVGLPYTSDIETLNVEFQGRDGTVQGKFKKIAAVTIRFLRSRGLWVGPDFDTLTEMKWRENELMGNPTDLLTGDKRQTLMPDWNTNGRVAIRQSNPLPMEIQAIIPEFALGG